MPKAASICSGVRSISLPAAAAAPKIPIAAVRCHPRSSVLASAIRHDTSRPSATANRRSRPVTPSRLSHVASTAPNTETPGWIEPPVSSVSSKSSAWPMLALSNAACGAGRRIPRSKTRLSASPPSERSPQRARRSPDSRFRRACSQRYREYRGGRIRRRSRTDPRSRCGKRAGPGAKRHRRS